MLPKGVIAIVIGNILWYITVFLSLRGIINGGVEIEKDALPPSPVKLLIVIGLNLILAFYYHKVMMKFAY